jgi:hypothetical protein
VMEGPREVYGLKAFQESLMRSHKWPSLTAVDKGPCREVLGLHQEIHKATKVAAGSERPWSAAKIVCEMNVRVCWIKGVIFQDLWKTPPAW